MIYTSYFANLKNIPNNIVPVAICAGVPKFWSCLTYKKLAPTFSILMKWKKMKNNDLYIEEYVKSVLGILDPNEVVRELKELTKSEDIVLLCYETSDCFCHRHLITSWFHKNGIQCKEWNNE